jgi:putative aldouronate transport system substrate-binding protein
MGKKRAKLLGIVIVILMMTIASACTGAKNSPASSAGMVSSPAETAVQQKAKQVTYVRSFSSGQLLRSGDTIENNVWTRDFKAKFNIDLVTKWTVNDQQYNNKITVSMVSGDLPDLFAVNDQQLQLLIQADQVMDLTDAYNQYASDLTKSSYGDLNAPYMQSASSNGKLMALPILGGALDDAPMIWIRNDWLKNVGMAPPKNMDDVVAIAKAFANNDPDKNGKKDTFGLSLDNNLFNGWSGLDGFFNGYHAYPFNPSKGGGIKLTLQKGADGKPIYADVQPEVKTALGKLQELFKAGAINPEFSVIDGGKSAELATSNKVGMSFGQWWVGTWPIADMKKADPKVDWQAYPLVSADDKPVKALSTGFLPNQFYVVNKKAKNPDAIFTMLNYFMEQVEGPNQVQEYHDVTVGDKAYQIWTEAPINSGFKDKNIKNNEAIQVALKSGDATQLNPQAKAQYDGIQQYKAGDNSKWWSNAVFGEKGSWGIIAQYQKDDSIITSNYLGPATETMLSKGPSLRDEEVKTFTKIIMGDSLDTFDAWAKSWHEQGGDQIIQEVTDSGLFK